MSIPSLTDSIQVVTWGSSVAQQGEDIGEGESAGWGMEEVGAKGCTLPDRVPLWLPSIEGAF